MIRDYWYYVIDHNGGEYEGRIRLKMDKGDIQLAKDAVIEKVRGLMKLREGRNYKEMRFPYLKVSNFPAKVFLDEL